MSEKVLSDGNGKRLHSAVKNLQTRLGNLDDAMQCEWDDLYSPVRAHFCKVADAYSAAITSRIADLETQLSEANAQLAAKSADWSEDFELENGRYFCQCASCGVRFIGHKRRVTCKACASNAARQAPVDADKDYLGRALSEAAASTDPAYRPWVKLLPDEKEKIAAIASKFASHIASRLAPPPSALSDEELAERLRLAFWGEVSGGTWAHQPNEVHVVWLRVQAAARAALAPSQLRQEADDLRAKLYEAERERDALDSSHKQLEGLYTQVKGENDQLTQRAAAAERERQQITESQRQASEAWSTAWDAVYEAFGLPGAPPPGDCAELRARDTIRWLIKMAKQLPDPGEVTPTANTPAGYSAFVRRNHDVSWVAMKFPVSGRIVELCLLPQELLEQTALRIEAQADRSRIAAELSEAKWKLETAQSDIRSLKNGLEHAEQHEVRVRQDYHAARKAADEARGDLAEAKQQLAERDRQLGAVREAICSPLKKDSPSTTYWESIDAMLSFWATTPGPYHEWARAVSTRLNPAVTFSTSPSPAAESSQRQKRKVEFKFDERSRVSVDELKARGIEPLIVNKQPSGDVMPKQDQAAPTRQFRCPACGKGIRGIHGPTETVHCEGYFVAGPQRCSWTGTKAEVIAAQRGDPLEARTIVCNQGERTEAAPGEKGE